MQSWINGRLIPTLLELPEDIIAMPNRPSRIQRESTMGMVRLSSHPATVMINIRVDRARLLTHNQWGLHLQLHLRETGMEM